MQTILIILINDNFRHVFILYYTFYKNLKINFVNRINAHLYLQLFYPELRKRLELSEQLFACNKQLPAAKEVDEQLLNAKIEKPLSATKDQPSASKKQLPASKGQQSESDEQLTAASELQSASRKQLPATLAQQASAIQCDVVLHCQDGNKMAHKVFYSLFQGSHK